eukprot:TRINITY_DN4180_c0_g1_i1.p1 TRINITY_DN4180_c0_g1~~TRINITY_DN4180_c0_g1_i1.p1  ORF type:complete len:556 (+),score=63.13 TRINITY_DN4180_c0_g1_i1:22-1689(+)
MEWPLPLQVMPLFECTGWCCKSLTTKFEIWPEWWTDYTSLVMAAATLFSLLYLLARLNKGYGSGKGELLRVYHAYAIILVVWLVLSVLAWLLFSDAVLVVFGRVLLVGNTIFDNWIVVLCWFNNADASSINKSIALIITLTVGKGLLLLTYTFENGCGICNTFLPAPQIIYSYLVFFVIYLFLFIASIFKKPVTFRKSSKNWILYMLTVNFLFSISVFLILQKVDLGYCSLELAVFLYCFFYSIILYSTFSNDSREVVSNSLFRGNISRESSPLLYYKSIIKKENTIKLIQFEDLNFGQKIGVGGYGEVFRGRWNHTDVAVKRAFRKGNDKGEIDDFLKEVTIMSKLSHPNIVLFMGACIAPNGLYIITEYIHRGSLYSILHEKKEEIDFSQKIDMLIDSSRGMLYLHQFDPAIIHRDIKTQNLLVDEHWRVKVCDFGLSRIKISETMSRLGTIHYSAPEVLRGERYTEMADIYSFAIVMWELLTASIPFDGWPPLRIASEVAYRIQRPEIPDFCPPGLRYLITECWSDIPESRPHFAEILVRLDEEKMLMESGL